ncbi:MAG: MbtH family protein [Actinobacteria bacterium]|nr:MbtH family protein [Actinomycetota bacterium]
MTNPFEDPNGTDMVLVNHEGQYALWPDFIDMPAGWTVVHGRDARSVCIQYVETHWTDMRPNSLIQAMDGSTA